MRFLVYVQRTQSDPAWHKLPIGGRYLHCAIALSASREGWCGYGIPTLMSGTGLRESNIYRLLRLLMERGFIEKDENRNGAYYVRCAQSLTLDTDSEYTTESLGLTPLRVESDLMSNESEKVPELSRTRAGEFRRGYP